MTTRFLAQVNEATGCDPSQAGLNLSNCLTLNESQTVADVYETPASLLSVIIPNLFFIAGLIFFVLLIYSGYRFIMADKKGMEDARQMITTAIVGFVVMFAAYWVIQILQIITGTNLGL